MDHPVTELQNVDLREDLFSQRMSPTGGPVKVFKCLKLWFLYIESLTVPLTATVWMLVWCAVR